MDELTTKFNEATDLTDQLKSKQDQVDQLLEIMPKVSPDYQRLANMRADSRGFFQDYVLPAWQTVTEYIQNLTDGFGIIPLLVAGVAVATALAAIYAYNMQATAAIEHEDKILNDPSIPTSLKQQLLTKSDTFSSLSSISSNVKYIALGGGALFILYQILAHTTFRKRA